ncbi:MAG: methyltransferase domain-containing protein [Nocardioidaceae bacterium]
MSHEHRYTHGHAESVLRSHRWRTAENSVAYLLPHLGPGLTLLDVGSGPGTITADLAERVAPGRVTALEVSEETAALTRDELDRRDVAHATVRVGDVHALPFPDDTFDVVHAHQVLHHVADPVQALREMARVARPGGLVAVRETDFGGYVWHPASAGLDRWLALFRETARSNGGEPDAGRRLLGWAVEAGLAGAAASATTWCFASPEDRAFWGGMWADRMTTSSFGDQLVESGRATRDEVDEIVAAWHSWSEAPDGWFSVLHGEVLARV